MNRSKPNMARVIAAARQAVLNAGWTVDEEHLNGDQCHLVLIKNGKRKGWGLFDRLYCWTEAYEAVTGRHWLELVAK